MGEGVYHMRLRFLSFVFYISDLIKKINSKLREDAISAYASQVAFSVIISAFPFCMLLLTLLQYIPLQENDLFGMMNRILPDTIYPFVMGILSEVYTSNSFALTSVTAFVTLWSGSKGFLALLRGINAVYGIEETRNYFHLRFLAAIYTLIFAIMLVISLLLLVFGNSIAVWLTHVFPLLRGLVVIVISVRVIALLSVLLLFFLALFLFVPNRKSHVLLELPGALLTALGWIGFSFLYSFYIDNIGNFSRTYGSLTAIVLSMVWLYTCMYMMFIGAELNSILFQVVLKKEMTDIKDPAIEAEKEKAITVKH